MNTPEGKTLLKQFVDRIFSINSPSINIFGTNVPGMSGSSAAIQGGLSSAAEVMLRLRQQTINLARAYIDTTVQNSDINKLADVLEGSILNESVLSVLNKTEADSLIDQLHDLIESRN